MAKFVRIRDLKNIDKLDFEVPSPGVYLLSGTNGAGKTSLLACLRRIGFRNAFAKHFPVSEQSDKLDDFSKARIIYEVNGRKVKYSHAGQRWVPQPKRNSNVLSAFGFSSVIYVGATADRITPRPEDFDTRRIRGVGQDIKDAANSIFETERFDGLRYINLTRGSANQAFVLKRGSGNASEYFSEKNFSLGELCVIKLLRQLSSCDQGALVLIDEIELALHPRAQVNLFNYVKQVADDKGLTVVFSTHSVSLIKTADRRQILHLAKNGSGVELISSCFPTYAIGDMALDEESLPDKIVFTEDDAAASIARVFVKAYNLSRYAGQSYYPTVHVVPIGGFLSVIRFLDSSDALLPRMTQASALLDADVKDETLAELRRSQSHERLQEFQRQQRRTFFLPFTPECSMVEFLRDFQDQARQLLRDEFQDHRLGIPNCFGRVPMQPGGEQRRLAKDAMKDFFAAFSANLADMGEREFQKKFYEIFAKWYFDNNRGQVMQLIGRTLN
ncbi:ATP-dependent nuclease [Halomonas denitrificans]|uniref:ATP-dependent nuclease n=1 Tax=Halomonas denitrificans TaxID=370769 RepID=UPI000D33834B|nr:AAA family ATPase [Halomonas denitrificans]